MCAQRNKTDRRAGFTLLEAVVALFLAALGLGVLYQGFAASARMERVAEDRHKILMVAEQVLQRARSGGLKDGATGEQNGIAWQVVRGTLAERDNGSKLAEIQVRALAPDGAQVNLRTEVLVTQP